MVSFQKEGSPPKMHIEVTDVEQFKAYLPELIKDVSAELASLSLPPDATEWIIQVLNYNLPGGKMNRGLAVAGSVLILTGDREKHLKKAIILGWCIEILQSCFLIADDVMDQSSQRRGKPCWYKKVGLTAVNDSLIMESIVYRLLKKHFGDQDYYIKLVELFHNVTWRTELGQLLDLTSIDATQGDSVGKFTLNRYVQTIVNKTAYYSFVLPVHAALILTGQDDAISMKETEDILLELGQFFQIQDDYLDFYGDSEITGKVGTDIEEGKCTWLALQFLQCSSADEVTEFANAIGKPNLRSTIANLYREKELDKVYKSYQDAFRTGFYQISLENLSKEKVKAIAAAFAGKILDRQN